MSGIHMALLASGGDNVVITLTNQSIQDSATSPFEAYAGYRVASDGKVYSVTNNGGTVELEEWCTPTSAASNYEVRATLNVGSLSSGVTGTWLALSSTYDWVVTRTAFGSQLAELTMEIRKTGTSTVLASATVELFAEIF